jgi:hypothetical protein
MAGGYRCAHAHQRAQRLACKPRVPRKMVHDNAVWNRVLESLRGGLSPEQASGILQRMPDPVRISHETICSALYAMPRGELKAQVLALLPHGRKTRCSRSAGTDHRGLIPNAVSIDERPSKSANVWCPTTGRATSSSRAPETSPRSAPWSSARRSTRCSFSWTTHRRAHRTALWLCSQSTGQCMTVWLAGADPPYVSVFTL